MDRESFWHQTYTHYSNLTRITQTIKIRRNKKTVRRKAERFRYKRLVGLVVEHHRHYKHGNGFAIFEPVYRSQNPGAVWQ